MTDFQTSDLLKGLAIKVEKMDEEVIVTISSELAAVLRGMSSRTLEELSGILHEMPFVIAAGLNVPPEEVVAERVNVWNALQGIIDPQFIAEPSPYPKRVYDVAFPRNANREQSPQNLS